VTDDPGLVAAIVSVGNELLYGETVDTNAAWLGRTLTARGVTVRRRVTARDDRNEITLALEAASAGTGLVIVTGGLGPTADDLTKATVAAMLGLPLVRDEVVAAQVAARFEAAGRTEVPASSLGQAEVPEGAHVLKNVLGTAPGLLMKRDGGWIVLLPGVPSEMKRIVTEELLPRLEEAFGLLSAVCHRTVHTTGIPESALADALEPALAELHDGMLDGVKLAYLPDREGVDLRFTFEGCAPEIAERRFSEVVIALGPVLDPWRYESESGDLAEAVLTALRATGRTIAVAESCTGGWVLRRLTDHGGCSDVVLGGVVAYANPVKVRHLGVSAESIDVHGAVSGEVAQAMAEGVARQFEASASISITGVAGPGGGSEAKPVGTVWSRWPRRSHAPSLSR
jgi:nicotinamide-nucleotide amidase